MSIWKCANVNWYGVDFHHAHTNIRKHTLNTFIWMMKETCDIANNIQPNISKIYERAQFIDAFLPVFLLRYWMQCSAFCQIHLTSDATIIQFMPWRTFATQLPTNKQFSPESQSIEINKRRTSIYTQKMVCMDGTCKDKQRALIELDNSIRMYTHCTHHEKLIYWDMLRLHYVMLRGINWMWGRKKTQCLCVCVCLCVREPIWIGLHNTL